MELLEVVKKAVNALEDKKAEDITVIDISEVSSIAEYFIIANGSNANQLAAMQDAVDEAFYKAEAAKFYLEEVKEMYFIQTGKMLELHNMIE